MFGSLIETWRRSTQPKPKGKIMSDVSPESAANDNPAPSAAPAASEAAPKAAVKKSAPKKKAASKSVKKSPKKAAPKKAVKKSATKAVKKSSLPPIKKRPDDDAAEVARRSDHKLNTMQVRILRSLKKFSNPIDRRTLIGKIGYGQGIGRGGTVSQSWATSLLALEQSSNIRMTIPETSEGRAKQMFAITANGRKLLDKVESAK